MALMQWTPALSVNVKAIDEQHKQLIKLINDLDDAMAKGRGKDVMGKIVTELATYARTHFAFEETHFAKFNFDGAAAHKQEHAKFLADVGKFKADFDANKLGLSIKVMQFLSDWLKSHIMGTDQKYSACFNANGMN